MKPHTVIQKSVPSMLLRNINSDDPRKIAYAIEALMPVIEEGGGRAGYTVEDIKDQLIKPNAKGITPLGRIAESSVEKLGHNISGSRRAQISAKRSEVLVWAIDNGLESKLFEKDSAGTSPFSRFVVATQAWNGNNPKARAVMDAVSWDIYRDELEADLKKQGVSPKNLETINELIKAPDLSI